MEAVILEELKKIAGEEQVRGQELMKKHTTFRTGGAADYFVVATSEQILSDVIALVKKENIPYFIIGNGSNLLFLDEGFRGVVIQLAGEFLEIHTDEKEICAGAGVLLSKVAARARDFGLTGMEFAAGIPGSIGGAVVMNAGAYGGEMKDIIVRAKVMDKDGTVFFLTRDELELSYRHSIVMEQEWIVLSVCILLEHGKKDMIQEKMSELAGKRREKQPLEYPSAGSTFKRPTGCFAGKLIQDAGLSGFSVGDAQVSEKHAGFVINKGSATTNDILELIRQVQEKVYEDSGVRLEMEVRVVR